MSATVLLTVKTGGVRTAVKGAARAVLAFHTVREVILSPPRARVGRRCDGDETEECERESHNEYVRNVLRVAV